MTPRTLKRTLLAIGGAGALLLLAGLIWAVRFERRLETPEWKAWLLEQARAALGVEVRSETLHASLIRGVQLRGVTVANPPGFAGPFLTAEAFTLRHDLWPLLRGRLQVDELSVEKPALNLALDSSGAFNYEKLLGQRAAARRPAAATRSGLGMASLMAMDLSISHLTLRGGRLKVLDGRRVPFLTLEGAEVDTSLTAVGGSLQGSGKTRIEALGLANMLVVRGLSAPLGASKQRFHLGPIKGRLAGGTASGDLDVNLGDAFRYKVALEVKGSQVQKLMEEARSASSISGSLEARGNFEGVGGLATLRGEGKAEVSNCRVRQAPLFVLLANALRVSELADPKLDTCRLELNLGGGRARTPVVRLSGPELRLTGHGVTDLRDGSLDYDMTLALSQGLRNRIPIKEVRAAFQEAGDGFGTLDFRVTGTLGAPRSDIAGRLVKAGAMEVVKDRLGRFLGRDR